MSTRRSGDGDPGGLADLQVFMAGALQRRGPLNEDADLGGLAAKTIAGNSRLSPLAQLDIYREQFWLRHVGSLRDDFPSLVHVLGDDGFDELARAYVTAHPPTSFTLRDLGDKMAQFVQVARPWMDDTLLADIARLEWAFIEAFDAPDAPPLDPTALASAPEEAWARARLVFQPSMQRLALDYPVHDLRGQVRAGEDAERPAGKSVFVVIYRAGLGHAESTADKGTLQYIDVEPIAFELLEALAGGALLGKACEDVAQANGAADASTLEARVGSWFQQWAAFGWISRIDFA